MDTISGKGPGCFTLRSAFADELEAAAGAEALAAAAAAACPILVCLIASSMIFAALSIGTSSGTLSTSFAFSEAIHLGGSDSVPVWSFNFIQSQQHILNKSPTVMCSGRCHFPDTIVSQFSRKKCSNHDIIHSCFGKCLMRTRTVASLSVALVSNPTGCCWESNSVSCFRTDRTNDVEKPHANSYALRQTRWRLLRYPMCQ